MAERNYGLIAIAARLSASSSGPRVSRLLGTRLAHDNVSSFEIRTVEGGDSAFGFLVGTHFHEAEPLGLPAEFIGDNSSAHHGAVLTEVLLKPFFGHRIGKISNVQLRSHMALLVAPDNDAFRNRLRKGQGLKRLDIGTHLSARSLVK
jgi:hypothetical protein